MVASADPSVSDAELPDDRGERLPDLRILLGDVHRELDELPDRGDRAGAAGQRDHARDAHRAARRCSSRPARWSRRDGQAVLRRGRRVGAAAVDRRRGRRSRTRWRSTSRWAGRPTRSCTCSRPRTRRAWTSGSRRSTSCPGGCRACARSRRTGSYHVEDVHRAGGIHTILGELDRAGLLNRSVHTVHGAPARRPWDLRSESVLPRGRGAVPRRARRGADDQGVLAVGAVGVARPRRRPPGASATSRTRTPPTAGSACCTGTWRRTARS